MELSLANVVEARCLAAIHRELPAIEEEAGVTIRFLAAISRHDDLEWDLDLIERFKAIARSRYFAGVDFMGHETNSTRAFARQLRAIADWAHADRPGFVVRVHAGENPAFPENVRVAAESVAGRNVSLRVGHGIYGVDERTMELLRAARGVVELNPSSNLALNNIQSAACLPARRYVEAGVPVALGTDGYGIYQTTLELEARAAMIAGLEPAHLARAAQDEARYVEARRTAEAGSTAAPAVFVVPADVPGVHYTPDVPRRKERERELRRAALDERLRALHVRLLAPGELDLLVADKLVISVAGSWRESWKTTSAASRESVARELDALFGALRADGTVVVTGGTIWGVEHEAQRLARARGLTTLAALVAETTPESVSPDLTHAWIVAPNLHAKAAGLYDLVRRSNGLALFVGGGGIVADEIQTASNLRLRYFVMDGPEGASTRHAERHPSRAFRTGAEVALRLAQRRWPTPRDPYWHPGPNPTVDVVLFRTSPTTGAREVLLVRRDETAASEAGKWALPGAFQRTDAPRGAAWAPGRETARDACLRVLRGETGLDASAWVGRFVEIGEYEGEGRDPRDTPEAWSRSIALAGTCPPELARLPIAGGHDASDARWFALGDVPTPLAFDHARILADAVARDA